MIKKRYEKFIYASPEMFKYTGDPFGIYCLIDKESGELKMYKWINNKFIEIKRILTAEEENTHREKCKAAEKLREKKESGKYARKNPNKLN